MPCLQPAASPYSLIFFPGHKPIWLEELLGVYACFSELKLFVHVSKILGWKEGWARKESEHSKAFVRCSCSPVSWMKGNMRFTSSSSRNLGASEVCGEHRHGDERGHAKDLGSQVCNQAVCSPFAELISVIQMENVPSLLGLTAFYLPSHQSQARPTELSQFPQLCSAQGSRSVPCWSSTSPKSGLLKVCFAA